MTEKKILTVIGATGGQGGGVVRTFLTDPVLNQEWTVRAVTRDPSKETAQKYKEQGAEIIVVSETLDPALTPVLRKNVFYRPTWTTNHRS